MMPSPLPFTPKEVAEALIRAFDCAMSSVTVTRGAGASMHASLCLELPPGHEPLKPVFTEVVYGNGETNAPQAVIFANLAPSGDVHLRLEVVAAGLVLDELAELGRRTFDRLVVQLCPYGGDCGH